MPEPNEGAQGATEEGAQGTENQSTEQKSFIDIIPEDFRDKPWVKENATTPENFFKFLDNQNALVGKKGVIIPEADAPQEKKDAFYTALGRPATPEEYDLSPSEELKDIKRDEQMQVDMKKLYHQIGVPKDMATKFTQGLDKLLFEKGKEQILKEQADDKAFDNFNKTVFGDNKEARVARAQKILREDLPKEALPGLDKLGGEALSVVAVIADSLYAKYGQEDRFRGGSGEGSGTRETYEELSNQQMKLMENPAFTDWRHPEHASLKVQNDAIMAKMRNIKP